MAISFLLQSKKNPAPIYVRLSLPPDIDLKRKTGFFIDPGQWSYDKRLPKQGDADLKRLTSSINQLSKELYDALNDLTKQGEQPTGIWLQQQIDFVHGKRTATDEDLLTNYIQKYIDALPYKEFPNGKHGATRPTITKYKTLKIKIEDFEKYKKKSFYLKDVNPAFRNELIRYFREVDKLAANTSGRYIKFLKTVCLDADSNGYEVSKQLKQVKGFTEKAVNLVVNFDELEKIELARFTRPALDNARDWLIIGCYIGQRVGDLLALTKDNIVFRAGMELIELTQQKTGKSVSIPLHPKVKEILNKRDGNFPTAISDVKFNLHIKDICKDAGLTQMIQGAKIDKETNRKVSGIFPKWELVTSHICRRSFASNFYGEISTPVLIAATGHSSESQFLAYIGKTADDYALQLAEYWRKQALEAEKKTQLTVVKKAN